MSEFIFHLLEKSDWDAAQIRGEYFPSAFAQDGFIHCATAEQLPSRKEKYFKNVKDLIALKIDPTRLKSPLRFERNTPKGDLYPHIYGPISTSAVVEILKF